MPLIKNHMKTPRGPCASAVMIRTICSLYTQYVLCQTCAREGPPSTPYTRSLDFRWLTGHKIRSIDLVVHLDYHFPDMLIPLVWNHRALLTLILR